MNKQKNINTAVALLVVLVCALGGYLALGLTGVIVGVLVSLVIGHFVNYLLPTATLAAVDHARPTASMYHGAPATLANALGWAESRSAAADADRLRAGVRLCTRASANRDGSQTFGHLLFQLSPEGKLRLAWQPRGKTAELRPIAESKALTVRFDRQQENAVLTRMGYVCSLDIGAEVYWIRRHDAEVLAPFTSAAPSVSEPDTGAVAH